MRPLGAPLLLGIAITSPSTEPNHVSEEQRSPAGWIDVQIAEARRLIAERRLKAALVASHGVFLGLLTEGQILRRLVTEPRSPDESDLLPVWKAMGPKLGIDGCAIFSLRFTRDSARVYRQRTRRKDRRNSLSFIIATNGQGCEGPERGARWVGCGIHDCEL